MKLTLGFSPCPNDTFIFDALVNKKINTGGIEFDVVLEDVETLNQWAMEGKLDITKLSFPAFFNSIDHYVLLNSGSALGKGVGPLLIKKGDTLVDNIASHSIAIPGINTTANLLLSFSYPKADQKTPMIFSAIEDAVLNGETDLGVIIHENRFTYKDKGLAKVADLGENWEKQMKVPIPLGGIAIQRKIDTDSSNKIDLLIRNSIEYAFSEYPKIASYVKQHSQTMSEEVMRQHIELYVNNYSLDLGETGKNAIKTLYDAYKRLHSYNDAPHSPSNLFLT
ncbi:MAG: 1,4-dihydroxy-6-naphthoate synthase [Chitinophagaceae bacterium]|nr:1,4-dihydroxy-6-naphthoate synthase [Chitinophagaceae bacterium]MCB9056757.1 1,4-dihydroxy-6-naphthoate synthase [Chitinophagales bacterium]